MYIRIRIYCLYSLHACKIQTGLLIFRKICSGQVKLDLVALDAQIGDHAPADNVLAGGGIFYAAEGSYDFVVVYFHVVKVKGTVVSTALNDRDFGLSFRLRSTTRIL